MPDPTPEHTAVDLSRVIAPARVAERRIRFDRALKLSVRALAIALLLAAGVLVLRKTGHASERVARAALALAGAGVAAAFLVGWTRPLARRAGAVALDKHHGLSDRLSSALSFSELPEAERSPFMLVAIEDGLAAAGRVDPKMAVPITRPPELPIAVALVVVVVGLSLFEVRRHEIHARADMIDAVDVTQDDLDAMREFLRQIDQRVQTDEGKAATQEFNQLIEDLANKRLDRTEAFRRMQQLEDKLLKGNEADAKALEDALKKLGEELKKAELSKPTGEALSKGKLPDAEKALKDLAKKLREQGTKIDKAQLEKLRDAMKKAAADNAKRMEELSKRRDELKEQLLKQKQKMGDAGANEEEKSLLKKKERELERLEREREQAEKAQRELDRLDRELNQAAEDLMKDLGMSSKDLDKAAQDINRMARQEMSKEEKQQLRQKLQELREMLRRQAQGGKGQMQRLRVFQARAHGQGQGQQGKGQQQGQGQQGQGQQGQGQQGQGQGQQAQGQGQQGQGQQGQGQQGQGQGKGQGQGEVWILGPNGEKIMMISAGRGQGQGQQPGGQGQGQQKGPGWGTGHDANVQGKATNPKVGTQDTQVAGQDTGQGATRSEVILGAAERGFASKGYQKVFTEYHTVAEEALDKDQIPGGYRSYVRRYFQLIRPRDSK